MVDKSTAFYIFSILDMFSCSTVKHITQCFILLMASIISHVQVCLNFCLFMYIFVSMLVYVCILFIYIYIYIMFLYLLVE